MRIYADLHIHSKYSRATSKNLNLENLEKYGKIKGVNLMGTGDFQHPDWNKELKVKLTDDGTGILKTSTGYPFLCTSELSMIYSQDGKGRRNHLVMLAPNLEVVGQIQEFLLKHGRIDYDGRPIFKIPCNDFVYEMRKISEDIEVIPAHIWTPHFSLFGDYNQYTKVEDCFKDQTKHIHAMETGISSDPPMNWRLSQLDKFNLVSFSDSHSFWPWRLGREATMFDVDKLTYKNILDAIRTGVNLTGTIESEPNFGKYHFTGHRNCGVVMAPKDALSVKYICPKCSHRMPMGVADRIEQLADRPEGYRPKNAKQFYSLIPLSELIAALNKTSVATQKVWQMFYTLVNNERSELQILLETPEDELVRMAGPKLAKVIMDNRNGNIRVQPGYDGTYGIPLLEGQEVKTYKPNPEDLMKAEPKQEAIAASEINKDDSAGQSSLSRYI